MQMFFFRKLLPLIFILSAPVTYFFFGSVDSGKYKFGLFLLYVVVYPFLETVMYQFITQELVLRFGWGAKISIAVSWVVFLLAHTGGGVRVVVPGLIGGGILAFTYGLTRRWGRGNAFISTLLLHATWNCCAIIFINFSSGIK
ncbi:CPBP family glutamic-type intramembrane protease [Xanthomonas nasturtii]|uniref:CPBP family intramembrane metalloprotease n=1 Tax=Xanthomonas nasturtii TaxID=1843581 RepID=A0A3E1KJP8_9XANT|nr:CPBP family glutamic-type intramembrane protease [Xanthomonas nasturtii]MCL1498377.1 CPBP family glutamic-type intramembrane protease [Xanthomonas nasturtii]MCL1501962.1 CPBP family glutamic-type intramembrane protease [Xanthomonas nasturtii]MCL1521773.1 CPBP family glutamic-type intramembrane protease [Xanthomonas nasturtii]MCL1531067.1 CPBP family glutamic-type intramembrane protease [Xanthomonas nasturtii]MCL1566274.1 CPBP family glutamic-type intramembrane protease [Xanthomonas nasturti